MARLLGIDIGTTATKAVVLDTEGGLVAEAERPTELIADHPAWAEEDVEAWWANLVSLTRELLADGQPAAVGVSGMVPCVVLLGHDGRPLRRSIQQNDARAVEEIAQLRAELDEAEVLRRTGSPITQQSLAPTLRWLQRHEPEAMAATRTILGSYDAMTMFLTGVPSVELNWAVESGLYDLGSGAWAADVLEAIELDPTLLPPVRAPSEVVGSVTAAATSSASLSPSVHRPSDS